jgi:lipid II:glycine glycyltransferase (peptidoglycan interpeptide bridge formation enzyme)
VIIKDISVEQEWENFLSLFEDKTFLCSWAWGEFRKSLGEKIYRKGVYLNDKLIAVFFFSLIKARKGDFLLLTHSLLIKEYSEQVLDQILSCLIDIGRKEKACFIRMAPVWQEDSLPDKFIKAKNFINSPCSIFPEKSWELSLVNSEEKILSEMRKKTSYLIRKTQKSENLEIFESNDLKKFYEIYQKTSARQGFKPFSFEYIEKEFNVFLKRNQAFLLLAQENGKCVAGAMVILWQKTAFYHHGASVAGRNSFSVPALLQWQAIKEAKKRNCQKYNFWVIAPNNDPNHRWAGLTFFKKGFGGNETTYAKTKDLPLSSKYYLTYFLEKIKRNSNG